MTGQTTVSIRAKLCILRRHPAHKQLESGPAQVAAANEAQQDGACVLSSLTSDSLSPLRVSWLMTVRTRAMPFLTILILASLLGAPPVTLATRRACSSPFSSLSYGETRWGEGVGGQEEGRSEQQTSPAAGLFLMKWNHPTSRDPISHVTPAGTGRFFGYEPFRMVCAPS